MHVYIYIGIHVFLYFVPFPRIKTWKNTCQSLIYRSLKSPFILWEHTRPPETWVPRCQSLGLSTQLPRLTANLGPGDLVSSWSHRDFHGIPSARWCFWVSHQLNPNVFDDVMYFYVFLPILFSRASMSGSLRPLKQVRSSGPAHSGFLIFKISN